MSSTAASTTNTRLDILRVGEHAVVEDIGDGSAMMRRFASLGFVPGTSVRVVRVAPLGDPTVYALRGYRVSLRRSEAARIGVRRASH